MKRRLIQQRIDPDLVARVRTATVELRGMRVYRHQGFSVTVADIMEAALSRELRLLERRHNGGNPYLPLRGRLVAGRTRRL